MSVWCVRCEGGRTVTVCEMKGLEALCVQSAPIIVSYQQYVHTHILQHAHIQTYTLYITVFVCFLSED